MDPFDLPQRVVHDPQLPARSRIIVLRRARERAVGLPRPPFSVAFQSSAHGPPMLPPGRRRSEPARGFVFSEPDLESLRVEGQAGLIHAPLVVLVGLALEHD